MPEIKYEITGDASKLEGAAREAESALKAMDRAADGAAKSIDKAGKGADGAGRNLHGLKKLAQGSGFGQIAGDMEDIGEGMMALGPAGAAAAGGLLAIGASAVGTYKVIDALYEMSLALEDTDAKLADYYQKGLPGFTRASDEALKASSGLSESSQLLGDMMSQAGVIVASRVAPAFDELARVTAVAGLSALAALDAYEKWWDSVKESIGTTYDAVTAGSAFREDLDATTGATNEHRQAIDELIKNKQILADMEAINGPLQEKAIKLTKEKNEADKESDRIAKKRIADAEKRARTEEQLQDTLNGMFTEFLDPLQKIDEKYDELGDKVKKLGGSESDLAQVEMARHLAKMSYIESETDKTDDAAKAKADAAKAAAKEAADANKEAADKAKKQRDDEIADDNDKRKAAADATRQMAFTLADDLLQAAIDSAEGGTEAQKKAGLAAFNIQKAISTSQIVIDGILATSKALASAPPPANFALAAATGATYAALAVKAAAAKPPKFHTGTGDAAPDEMLIRRNERLAVMTRQGQQALGGPQGIAKINRGEAAGGTMVIEQRYQHKGYGAFVADNVRMSGSPLRKAIKGGKRVGHRAR